MLFPRFPRPLGTPFHSVSSVGGKTTFVDGCSETISPLTADRGPAPTGKSLQISQLTERTHGSFSLKDETLLRNTDSLAESPEWVRDPSPLTRLGGNGEWVKNPWDTSFHSGSESQREQKTLS